MVVLKWLGVILAVLLGLALLAAALLPMVLVSPEPAPGAPSVTAIESHGRHVRVPFPGTEGLDIHVLERPGPADGPTFILLHGFTLDANTWWPSLPLFAARGRVIAYDQPPYGLSAKPYPPGGGGSWPGEDPYAKSAAIEQLFALMDALEIEQAILVGNSSGGTLALEAALEAAKTRPERVAGLILVAPWVYVQRPTLPRWLAELPQMQRVSLLIARKLGTATLLDYSYADPARIAPERRALAGSHTQVAGWDLAWAALLTRSLWTPVEVSAHLAEVRQPTLVITGDQDRLVPPEDSRRVAEALPDANLRVIPNCGHLPQEECPTAFAEVVGPWLDAALPRAGAAAGPAASDR